MYAPLKQLKFVVSKSTAIMICTPLLAYTLIPGNGQHQNRLLQCYHNFNRDTRYCHYHGIMNQKLCIPALFSYICTRWVKNGYYFVSSALVRMKTDSKLCLNSYSWILLNCKKRNCLPLVNPVFCHYRF